MEMQYWEPLCETEQYGAKQTQTTIVMVVHAEPSAIILPAQLLLPAGMHVPTKCGRSALDTRSQIVYLPGMYAHSMCVQQ